MAKSIRSKWKRKMRAIKRKKNEVKELARLKKIVGSSKQDGGNIIQDIIMSDLVVGNLYTIIMAALWNKTSQHIFILWFLLSFFFFSSSILSCRRLDV